ncbi:uncharacterized protein DS421_10g298300 [Arachis hypogaea]|nr:uncharacterized protein DS421_10g298300 [Arachis hypogaea]
MLTWLNGVPTWHVSGMEVLETGHISPSHSSKMTTLPLTIILSSPTLSSSPAQPPTLLSSLFLPSQLYTHKTNAFTHMKERPEKGDASPVGCGPPSRHRQVGGRSRRRHASPSISSSPAQEELNR